MLFRYTADRALTTKEGAPPMRGGAGHGWGHPGLIAPLTEGWADTRRAVLADGEEFGLVGLEGELDGDRVLGAGGGGG